VSRHRPNALILSGLAIVAAVVAVIVVAAVSGVSLDRIFEDFRPQWIIVVAIAEAVSFVPYTLAYRQMTVVAGLEPPSLPVTITVVLSGFGPFVVGGGFRLDQAALMKVYGDQRTARVQVVGLIALEWAVLAPFACLSAIVLLLTGANVMGSLLWPWALCVPAGFALGLWLSVPERKSSRLRRFGPISAVLDGVGLLHQLIRAPGRTAPAWVSMALYWAAEIVALYAALRMFGVELSPARLVLAYATGYAVTRRSLPLAGAAITEVLLTFALHWVGTPLGPALAAVVSYRLFNLILVSVPSLLANRLLARSLARWPQPPRGGSAPVSGSEHDDGRVLATRDAAPQTTQEP
jgi:uncharacterized membrane protein YbhN (UPF0104 family)